MGFKRLVATCLAEKVDNQDVIYNRYDFYRYLRPQCDPSKPSYNPAQQKYFSDELPDEVEYYDGISGDKLYDTDGIKLDTLRDALNKQMELNEEEYKYEQIKMKRMNDSDHTYESKYVIRVTLSQCEPDEGGGYGSGDFRSKECTEILKNSDIVVTNPPFSLFRDFVKWLMNEKGDLKSCILVGNQNAITYKEIFPLIQENKLSTGYTGFVSDMYYSFPDIFKDDIDIKNIERAHKKGFKGNVTRLGNTCWFTTEKFKSFNEELFLYENYYEKDGVTPLKDSENKYPKYDNYDAIEVSKVKNIPKDYKGLIGVPITFLNNYNPDQFEIIGSYNNSQYDKKLEEHYVLSKNIVIIIDGKEKLWNGPVINKKPLYKRIVIRRKDIKE